MSQNLDDSGTKDTALELPLFHDEDIFNQIPNDMSLDFLHDGTQWSNEHLFWL